MASSDILEILKENDGSMERSQLETHLRGFSFGLIKMKLKKLEKEGSIKISGNTIILIPRYRAKKMLLHGNENEDGSIEPTGHRQVPIQYDQTLFRVEKDEEPHELIKEITVDEGMIDLLRAIWRHGMITTRSCQGLEGDEAWIRFQWQKDVVRFVGLIGHLSRRSGEKKWTLNEKTLEISFPPEDIAMMVEELNSKPIN